MTDSFNPFSLNDKTILITGASSGIGQATAVACSKLGAKLIITGRDESRLAKTLADLHGHGHAMITADLSDISGISDFVSNLPALDGAVLCAGMVMTIPIQFASPEKFNEVFNINFFSQTELTRLLFKKKKLNKGASLVLLASEGGTIAFNYGNAVYGASKAALNSFMQFCANEFATRNIRVNSICPGMIETPMIYRMTITDEQMQNYKNRYVLKRFGTPDDVALGAVYLLSDASSWTTGSSLIINGGGVSINGV